MTPKSEITKLRELAETCGPTVFLDSDDLISILDERDKMMALIELQQNIIALSHMADSDCCLCDGCRALAAYENFKKEQS